MNSVIIIRSCCPCTLADTSTQVEVDSRQDGDCRFHIPDGSSGPPEPALWYTGDVDVLHWLQPG